MNNAITLLLLLVMLLLGTSKHQTVRSFLAGCSTPPMRRSGIPAIALCSILLYGWEPTFRYGNSTPVQVEHRFKEQPKTRNETGVSETKSRYGDSLGAWAMERMSLPRTW